MRTCPLAGCQTQKCFQPISGSIFCAAGRGRRGGLPPRAVKPFPTQMGDALRMQRASLHSVLGLVRCRNPRHLALAVSCPSQALPNAARPAAAACATAFGNAYAGTFLAGRGHDGAKGLAPSLETGASRACGHCRYHAIYQAFPNHPSRACMRAALASIGRGSCGACRHWTQAHVRQIRLQCICAMQMAWLGRAAWQKGGAGNGGRCWQLRQGNPHALVLPARRPLSRMDGRRQVPMPAAAVPLSYFRPWLH